MPHAFILSLLVGNLSAAEPGEESSSALASIRTALATRDLAAAETAILRAKQLDGDAEYDEELQRLEELTDYVEQFWKSYDKGLATFGELLDELVVGETRMAVVEATPQRLLVRLNGRNKEYARSTVPAGIALAVAERVLKADSAKNKVIIGAFAAVDGKGDRTKARAYWQEAQAAGIDVAHLLPELKTERPLPAIEIPVLSPQQKLVLDPRNWSERKLENGRFDTEKLAFAEQNEAGQLVVQVPADQPTSQLVTRRAVSANFGCRIILQNVQAGQQFGLFASSGRGKVVVTLPAGTMMVEFARVGTGYQARIAGEEVEVEMDEDLRARFSGHIGVSAPAGSEFTVAAFEVTGR